MLKTEMPISRAPNGTDPVEPPYRSLELVDLKARGVRVRQLGVDHEHTGLFLTFTVEHKTNPAAFVSTAVNMLCDLFSQGDGEDCTHSVTRRGGEPVILLTVPASIADRLDTTVVPALSYLNDEQDDGFRVPTFGRAPR